MGTMQQLDRMLYFDPNGEIELFYCGQKIFAKVSEVWARRDLNTPKNERK
jgi:hypothetical protein